MQGPSRGPNAQAAMARPRISIGIMSAMLPLPMVMGMQPARPMRKRNAIIMPMLLLKAVQILKMVKKRLPRLYIRERPYISLIGATMRGPKAKPRM
jgi:hypothetical protein